MVGVEIKEDDDRGFTNKYIEVVSTFRYTVAKQINESDHSANYLLLFRELHNTQVHRAVRLRLTPGKNLKFNDIESEKSWLQTTSADGTANFDILAPGNYLFLKYETVN